MPRPVPTVARLCAGLLLLLASTPIALVGCGGGPEPLPSPEVERAIEQGQTLYDAQQYTEASSVFQQALIRTEAQDDLFGQAVCYLSLSLCFRSLGEREGAIRTFAEAQRLLPRLETEQPNLDRAELNVLYGRYHEVAAIFARAAGDRERAFRHLDQAGMYYRAGSDDRPVPTIAAEDTPRQ